MSVIVKDMQMPVSCLCCDLCYVATDTAYCRRLMKRIEKGCGRLDDCPLEEIPEGGGDGA